MDDSSMERDNNYSPEPSTSATSRNEEGPFLPAPKIDISHAVAEGKIESVEKLMVRIYEQVSLLSKDANNPELEDLLNKVREKYIDAKNRENAPMDKSVAALLIDPIEAKLTEINPDRNKNEKNEEDDHAFLDSFTSASQAEVTDDDIELAAIDQAVQGRTGSQSPVREPESDFEHEEVSVPTNTQDLQGRDKFVYDTVTQGLGNDIWMKANKDDVERLVKEGYLPETVLENLSKSETKTTTPKESAPKTEVADNKTFADVKLEHRMLRLELQKENMTSTEKLIAEAKLQSLVQRMDGFIETARKRGLLSDVESKYTLLIGDLVSYQIDGDMTALRKERFERDVANWKANEGKNTPPELKGVAAYYTEKKQAEIQAEIDTIKGSDTVFMKKVRDYTEPSIPKRVDGIEKRSPVEQRMAFRFFLEELESTKDKGRFDPPTNNLMSDLLKIAARKDIDSDVRAEVNARIHLHACAASLGKVVTSDAEKVSAEFGRAVSEIGDYALTGDDFETLLQDGAEGSRIKGLRVADAFYVLQKAAYRGEFSGKVNETESNVRKQRIIDQILQESNEPGFDRIAAEKSYDLAMRLAEATFETSVWDTSGGDYLSQAIYFSKWRSKEGGKGPQLTIDLIHSIGTSFFRNAASATEKFNDKAVKIVNRDDWNELSELGASIETEYRNVDVTRQNYKVARLTALELQRIQLPESNEVLAKQLYFDDLQKREQFLRKATAETNPDHARGMLDFDETRVNFHEMSPTAYKQYLNSTIPNILKAKVLLTKTDISVNDLQNDTKYPDWAGTLDAVDPYGAMNLRYNFMIGAIDSALEGSMDGSEADRVVRNLYKDKNVGGRKFIFLKEYLPNGKHVDRALKDVTDYVKRGAGNAMRQGVEGVFRIRK